MHTMKKALKIVGIGILLIGVFTVGAGFYFYQTDPMIKAIVENDESILYYFPVKEMEEMNDLDYSEKVITVDSLDIYTYFFKSAIKNSKGNIFFIHGAGGNVSKYAFMFKPLVENGYGVYALDWRGYGNSTGKPGYKGVLKDTQMAFADFKSKTESDSLKTIVYGTSLGGQLAVKIAKDNQGEIDALVLDGSIQSAQQMAIDYAPANFLKEQARRNPQDFNQEYVAVRDIKKISNLPKLIIHSQNDREVLFKHGENLYAAANEPKQFWITDTKHMMTLKEYPDEAIRKIGQLIE